MPDLHEFIASLDNPQREISERLQTLLDAGLDSAAGQVWHGHPVWLDGKTPVAGFKPYPKYVTFMIWNASPIEDSSDSLVAGPRMATIKYSSVEEIDDARVSDWLRQSQA